MTPKEQRLESFFDSFTNNETLGLECRKWIEKGFVIHQIIPCSDNTKKYYLLLYRY